MPSSRLFIVNTYTKQYYIIELYPNCELSEYDFDYIINKMNWIESDIAIMTQQEFLSMADFINSFYDKIDTYEIYTPTYKRRRVA
jgi:hypothetical protein